jgi:hypothetical protein
MYLSVDGAFDQAYDANDQQKALLTVLANYRRAKQMDAIDNVEQLLARLDLPGYVQGLQYVSDYNFLGLGSVDCSKVGC